MTPIPTERLRELTTNARGSAFESEILAMATELLAARDTLAALTKERDEAHKECDRLKGVLSHIDGGDNPCLDEARLRMWAFEGVTLGRSVEELSL